MQINFRDWGKSLGQNLLFAVLVALIPGAAVTWLAHVQSLWAVPALEGLGAMLLASGSFVAIRASRTLPPRRLMPNSENIESCIRLWLDSHKFSVKNDPSPESYFRLRIKLDSGVNLTVLRMKNEHPDYIQILCDMGIRGEDKKVLESFSEAEAEQIIFDIRLELARAAIGYSGLVNPPENFMMFRRLPIHHNLTEFIFIGTIGEVEAAHNLVILMFLKTKQQAEQKQVKTVPSTPLLNSGIPRLRHSKGE